MYKIFLVYSQDFHNVCVWQSYGSLCRIRQTYINFLTKQRKMLWNIKKASEYFSDLSLYVMYQLWCQT